MTQSRRVRAFTRLAVSLASFGLVAGVPTAQGFVTVASITNNSGAVRSDLHLDFTGTGGVSILKVTGNPPGCPAPKVTNPGAPWDIDWGRKCVAVGATVTVQIDSQVHFSSGRWTPDGVPVDGKRDVVESQRNVQGCAAALQGQTSEARAEFKSCRRARRRNCRGALNRDLRLARDQSKACARCVTVEPMDSRNVPYLATDAGTTLVLTSDAPYGPGNHYYEWKPQFSRRVKRIEIKPPTGNFQPVSAGPPALGIGGSTARSGSTRGSQNSKSSSSDTGDAPYVVGTWGTDSQGNWDSVLGADYLGGLVCPGNPLFRSSPSSPGNRQDVAVYLQPGVYIARVTLEGDQIVQLLYAGAAHGNENAAVAGAKDHDCPAGTGAEKYDFSNRFNFGPRAVLIETQAAGDNNFDDELAALAILAPRGTPKDPANHQLQYRVATVKEAHDDISAFQTLTPKNSVDVFQFGHGNSGFQQVGGGQQNSSDHKKALHGSWLDSLNEYATGANNGDSLDGRVHSVLLGGCCVARDLATDGADHLMCQVATRMTQETGVVVASKCSVSTVSDGLIRWGYVTFAGGKNCGEESVTRSSKICQPAK